MASALHAIEYAVDVGPPGRPVWNVQPVTVPMRQP